MYRQPLKLPFHAHAHFCLHPVAGSRTWFHSGHALVSHQPWFSDWTVCVPAVTRVPSSRLAGRGTDKWHCHMTCHSSQISCSHRRLEISMGSTAPRLKSAIKEACFKHVLVFSESLWVVIFCRERQGKFQIYHPRFIMYVWLLQTCWQLCWLGFFCFVF